MIKSKYIPMILSFLFFSCANVNAEKPISSLAPKTLQNSQPAQTTPPDSQPVVREPSSIASTKPAVVSQAADPIVLVAVGDIMMGTTFPDKSGGLLPPDDGVSMFSEVAPILQAADIAFGNLEGPLIDGGKSTKCPKPSSRCYAFRVPTRYGQHLKDAGFTVMSLANNHGMDFGQEGRDSSKQVLESLGIAHSGEIGDIAKFSIKDKKVALIAFATSPFSYNLNNMDQAKEAVSQLAKENDIVIVSFHGGAEGSKRQHVPKGRETFLGENRGDLRTFSHTMIDMGADVILGHGPHIVRGMEIYKGRLIAYSLGNFATYKRFNLKGPNGLSLLLELTLSPEGKFLEGQIHSARQNWPGGPVLDPTGEVIRVIQKLSKEDFGDRAVEVNKEGKILSP